MKRITLILLITPIYYFSFGQIVADHTVVDKFDKIPEEWINVVKTKLFTIGGRSHAGSLITGLQELRSIDSRLSVDVSSGRPLPYQTTALRATKSIWGTVSSPNGWIDDTDRTNWWTNDEGRSRIKNYLKYCADQNIDLFAVMYGWSYDPNFDHMYGNGPWGEYSPVYHVRWAGSTEGGIDGNKPFGLTDADTKLVGNRVNMDSYLTSINEYIQYCKSNNINTKVIFSTGPVDDNGTQGWNINERGYQQYLKWEHVRKYVEKQNNDVYLFDWADILSYNNAGAKATTRWEDNNGKNQEFPLIHPNNMRGTETGHIGTEGAIRLAKAMWWLLARMAGWDGSTIATNLETKTSDHVAIFEKDGYIEIQAEEDISGAEVSLININGQTLQIKQAEGKTCQINMRNLPSGSYLVVLKLEKPFSKVIVKH